MIARRWVIVLGCAPILAFAQLSTINNDPTAINGGGLIALDTVDHVLYGNIGHDDWNGPVNRIWQYRAGEFSSVGGGVIQPSTRGLQFHEGALFFSGTFSYGWHDGYSIQHLGRWDGTLWTASGEPNGMTYLFKTGEELWCMGAFDSIGGQPVANNLARLVGDQWESFGTELYSGSGLFCGALYEGYYYFGGNMFPPFIAEDVVRWDGDEWVSVAGGIVGAADAWVNDMVVYQDKLYVGGYFWDAGNITRNIKVWNGSSWEGFFPDLVTSISGQVHALEVIDDKLYLTGRWQFADDDRQFVVLIYDGEQLCGLGSAPTGAQAYHITGNTDSVFFGTTEYVLSGDTVNYYAVWPTANGPDTCVTIPTGMREHSASARWLSAWPNPVSDLLTVQLPEDASEEMREVVVTDALGREVLHVRQRPQHARRWTMDVGQLVPGPYHGRVVGDTISRFRFVKK